MKRKYKKKRKKKSIKKRVKKSVKKRLFKKRFVKKRLRIKKKIKRKKFKKKQATSREFFRKIVRITENFKPKYNFSFNLDKTIQRFFQNISDKIQTFKEVLEEERDRRKNEKLRELEKEKNEKIKQSRERQIEEIKKKEIEIKEEKKLEKERKLDLKKFIRQEQAQLRKEQAERQRRFYEKIKLEKKIEQFRKREALEIKSLEKFVLGQERENYNEVQERIDKIRQKYQAIRDQKIRERIEQLGIEVTESDTRTDLLEKERQFNIEREKIETTLESFYRSMASCVFQLNKRWLPKKMSLLRVIDNRYETSEIFIKSDDETDENWLMLVYLKDNNPNSKIIVEDKTNPNKNLSKEYQNNEIFSFSDNLVDSLTSMIDREFKRKLN